MSVFPVKIERLHGGRLLIEWSDGQRRSYSLRELQDNCPCATCREKRRQPTASALLPVMSKEETKPLEIRAMEPVGHYAYHIRFSQGCDTGIYTFELLRELGAESD